LKVYVSGAITGLPLDVARERFAVAADELAVLGHEPVNPWDVPPHHTCACLGTTSDDGAGGGHAWGCYLRGDLAALLDCDAILMLPGWESSHGARLELTVASAVGLRVWWSAAAATAALAGVSA
jgi:hypothetical protein